MTVHEIINTVIAGGLLGSLGQGIRVAVGLKKLNDSNAAQAAQGKDTEPFSPSRLLISIFVGFVAGALGMLIKGSEGFDYPTESIVTIIAVGYSGADFIEGLFNTYISKFTGTNVLAGSNPSGAGNASGGGNAPGRAGAIPQQPFLVNDESKPNPNQVLG